MSAASKDPAKHGGAIDRGSGLQRAGSSQTPAERGGDANRAQSACYGVGQLLRHLAEARLAGALSEASFIRIARQIEAEKAIPNGITFSSSTSSDNWTVFALRTVEAGDICGGFEFQPGTGEFRSVTGAGVQTSA